MTFLDARALIPFPEGANSSDTLISGVHLNLTTLKFWNYTLYDNGTVSNGSWCQLTGPQYIAAQIWDNGTFINGTSCYTPLYAIGVRSAIGIGFAVVYGLCLVLTLVNLARHGKMYLPAEKRFYPIGRRWQWYWGAFVCAMALVGLFFGVDVDRYPIQEVPLVINVFFWYLLQMGTMAMVWEGARHWGSWMERQFIDPNPFVLHEKDRRGMFEFWLPLFFYFWLWINFFMIIPRNWTPIMLQRSPDQTIQEAEPAAQDIRFKLAGFFLFICWCTICVSLTHSIRHYEPRNRGWFNRTIGCLGYLPFRFVLEVPILLGLVGYQVLCAFQFRLSPVNSENTNLIAMYVGGYLPALLLVIIQIVSGFMRPNEDKELMRQRRHRGDEVDRDLGIVRKPAWWRRVNGEMPNENMAERVMRNVREVGGGRPTARQVERMAETRAAAVESGEPSNGNIEMNNLRRTNSAATNAPPPYTPYGGKSDTRRQERAMAAAAGILFPNSPVPEDRGRNIEESHQQRSSRFDTNGRSPSAASGLSTSAQPQQIRSMLDI